MPLVDEYMAKGTKDNFANVVSTAPFYWQYHQQHYPVAKKFVEAFYDRYKVYPSNGAECAYVNMLIYKKAVEQAAVDRSGQADPDARDDAVELHQGPGALPQRGPSGRQLVPGRRGHLPEADRGPGGFGFAKVLEEHNGPGIMAPLESLSCKMETA